MDLLWVDIELDERVGLSSGNLGVLDDAVSISVNLLALRASLVLHIMELISLHCDILSHILIIVHSGGEEGDPGRDSGLCGSEEESKDECRLLDHFG